MNTAWYWYHTGTEILSVYRYGPLGIGRINVSVFERKKKEKRTGGEGRQRRKEEDEMIRKEEGVEGGRRRRGGGAEEGGRGRGGEEEEMNLLTAYDERQVATSDNVRRDTLMFGQRGLASISSKCLNRSE
ncbi:hypothetical protein BHM03_00057726 [Ensete ventricosum]|nr:hypothetical protein BHM03_00057726 [Ensete ventricosum]